MGNWNITIRGTGVHHNGGRLPEDANRMAAEFVQKLRVAGHTVSHASITHGGEDDLTMPNRYVDDLDAMANLPQRQRCTQEMAKGQCRLVEHHEGKCEPPVEWK